MKDPWLTWWRSMAFNGLLLYFSHAKEMLTLTFRLVQLPRSIDCSTVCGIFFSHPFVGIQALQALQALHWSSDATTSVYTPYIWLYVWLSGKLLMKETLDEFFAFLGFLGVFKWITRGTWSTLYVYPKPWFQPISTYFSQWFSKRQTSRICAIFHKPRHHGDGEDTKTARPFINHCSTWTSTSRESHHFPRAIQCYPYRKPLQISLSKFIEFLRADIFWVKVAKIIGVWTSWILGDQISQGCAIFQSEMDSFKSRSDLLYQSLWLFPNWANTCEKNKSSESSEASNNSKYIWRMLRCYRYLSMLSSHHEGWGLLFAYLWHYYYLWHGNAWQVEILTWFFLWHFCHDQSTMISPSSITYANQDSS